MSSQAYRAMVDRLARLFSDDPILAMDFYCASSEIVDDFEDYDGLMPNKDGAFDETTAIIKLQQLRNELKKRLDATSS
jgi:hypothetical protein